MALDEDKLLLATCKGNISLCTRELTALYPAQPCRHIPVDPVAGGTVLSAIA
jgi:hypothetical protein